jgi:prepilin-type N-terminal cleavage/methylation domain-containing protein
MNAMKKIGERREARAGGPHAFTLIELLVVIAVIAIIAAFLVPLGAQVKRHSLINRAQAEMAQLETAIDRYHAAYGFYPPDNPGNTVTNQLYFELLGVTNNNGTYYTLDGSGQIPSGSVTAAFGIGGFMNCSKTNADESTAQARNFLPDLKPAQMGTNSSGIQLLVSSVGGPLPTYQPMGVPGVNPWRYNSSSPTNNPGAYDLWIQIVITPGQTNLICNWRKQPQINNPLP